VSTVHGGFGSWWWNFFNGLHNGPHTHTQLTAGEQAAAGQAISSLSSSGSNLLVGDGSDTFAGGVTSFRTSDAVETVGGGVSSDATYDGTDLSVAGPTADGVKETDVTDTGTQVITMGDSTTVQLMGVAPTELPKPGY
jgi:hypothetical protein